MELAKSKHPKLKWIYLTISVLLIGFIIFHSCLDGETSGRWSGFFANFIMSIFNSSGKDTTEIVDVKGIDLTYTGNNYNFIEGYDDNELILGFTKSFEATILPSNASRKAVNFTISDASIASIKQDVERCYVTGLKEGQVTITAVSESYPEFNKEYVIDVIKPKVPSDFIVKDIKVYKDSVFDVPILIEDTHGTNISDYYDLSNFDLTINDTSFIDEYAPRDDMYQANKVGRTYLTVSDGHGNSKEVKVDILDNSEVVKPVITNITANNILWDNRSYDLMIETSNTPTSRDVMWSISDTSYASIDNKGHLVVKEMEGDKPFTITATSKLDTSISYSKTVTMHHNEFKSFELVIPVVGAHITNGNYTGNTGQEIQVWMEDVTGTIARSGVSVSSSDEEVAKVYAQGTYIFIDCIKVGNTRITITSNEDPTVSKYVDVEVTIRGIINNDNYSSFSEFVRKSIGHFLLFLVSGIFVFLFFNELDKDLLYEQKRKWHYIVFTLAIGLLVAGISELIQFFIPSRYGSLIDVLTDFVGFALGVGITYLIIRFIRKHRKRKLLKESINNSKE